MGCHYLLQGIFLTQGSNQHLWHLLHCRWILYSAPPWKPKNTMKKSESESCSVLSDSLWPQGLYSPWNSPGQNTGVGSLSLLEGIFPIQGSNPGLPHCRRIVYQLSHKGRPRIVKWVANPFSRESSQPRNGTRVSCSAGGFFTNWAMREAREHHEKCQTGWSPRWNQDCREKYQ